MPDKNIKTNAKEKNLLNIKNQIQQIKRELQTIGEMRPGSLTCQYHFPKEKKGAFYQLSYTRNMKGHTDYVRREFVNDLRLQIKNYKRFRTLTKRWVDLAMKYSKLKIASAIKKG
ncbi:MAG: hypothetical protein M1135_02205 [Candidatus Omnitrophica bacterium]|nr:hypothetical protein [Candidatus Omnitrophota bacterium]